jgi:hypothetical protein
MPIDYSSSPSVGFNIGASSSPAYDGSTLANDEDVIIVTLKYVLETELVEYC